jgi:hypothetical protein
MARTITEGMAKAVKAWLTVFAEDGSKVGYIDHVDKAHGWIQVHVGEAQFKSSGFLTGADERDSFVWAREHQLSS